MKKIYAIFALLMVTVLILCSCQSNAGTDDKTESNQTTSVNIVVDKMTGSNENTISDAGNNEVPNNDNDNLANDSSIGVGGTSYCEVHYSAYHMIPGWIIDYIGKDRYEEWIENLEFSDLTLWNSECTRPVNIKTVISEFNITEDEFTKHCNYPSDSVYNLNLLYNGTEEEIDKYYYI